MDTFHSHSFSSLSYVLFSHSTPRSFLTLVASTCFSVVQIGYRSAFVWFSTGSFSSFCFMIIFSLFLAFGSYF